MLMNPETHRMLVSRAHDFFAPPLNISNTNRMPSPEKLTRGFLEAIVDERHVDIHDTNEMLTSFTPKKLAAHGLAILNLVIGSSRSGLGGRMIAELEPDPSIGSGADEIDTGDVRVGDIVRVQPSKSKPEEGNGLEGVVTKVSNRGVSVAVEEKYEDNLSMDGRLWLVKLANSVTYRRMEYAMNDLSKLEDSEKSHLQMVLLGEESPSLYTETDIKFFDDTLNEPQQEAVKFSMGSNVSMIHGPPGTGKTYTLVEIIRQLVERKERVMVCGPSNISVDNILERLHQHIPGNKLVRLGHPARLLETNLIHSLDIVSKTSNEGSVLRDCRNEIDSVLKKVQRTRGGGKRKELWNQLKELRKEYKVLEKRVLGNIFSQAQVVVCTLHGAGSYDIKDAKKLIPNLFDTIIIDEVSQALEPQCWIPLINCSSAKKLIIAGDNLQLPPTVKTKSGKHKQKLETTIFDRLEKLHGDKIKRLLSIQYRMNTTIMDFPSKALYKGLLRAAPDVAHRRLTDLDYIDSIDETNSAVTWLDTQGDDYPEGQSEEDVRNSKYNMNEALLAAQYVQKLLSAGAKESDIGVITPYSAQVSLIRRLLQDYPGIEIATVDGFQGREKNAIVMSLVRSNDSKEVGFLAEKRRLNVAMTRPRMHLCVIGNMETISSDNFMKQWVEWAEDEADLDYPDVGDVLEA